MHRSSALGAVALLVGVVTLAGCPTKYPACDSDEDCNREQNRHEFCVNQLCQKCRPGHDKDCKEGTRCNKGRCDPIPGWCADDSQCPEEQTCKDHHCSPCEADSECGEGGKCKAGRCLRKGACDKDDDCPEGMDCKSGKCTPAGPSKASQEAPCKLASVYFDFNESVLSTEATQAIDSDFACMQKVGRGVELVGRSDPRGTEEYNLALSERRAQQVRDRLQRLGMDGGKLRILPKGELDATGHDEAGWAQDRRVDFEWL